MAHKSTFHCSVVTPERAVLETEAAFVAFPAHDGEVGVLPGRAPLLFQLGSGVLRVKTAEGEQRLFVSGGFAQMTEDRLTLLTEEAIDPEKIELEEARSELARALELPAHDDDAIEARQLALDRARRLLSLAPR